MSEMSTGQRPFDGYQFDEDLAINIIRNGLQPEFASGILDCYIALAKQCMDLDSEKRPHAYNIYEKISKWINIIEDSYEDSDEDADKIKRQFLCADEIVKTLLLNLPKHPDMMYTSKIINTKNIMIAINAILIYVIEYCCHLYKFSKHELGAHQKSNFLIDK
ncbi:hypothetical protein C2G38_1333216 [Gigaspora rosea]|uniref:Serine-threonine/tyrosine-protein kinase catalytic domain-containing protein n=1 Tax=Gigaspora rosea TaxID=44941 RepID=A0A397TPK2_9GLOM|nr:hypothetical protein C2G38_1333216 [Gigaspora rosea]